METKASSVESPTGGGFVLWFLIALMIPVTFSVNDVLLSPLRICLLFLAVPVWITVKGQRFGLSTTDLAVLGFCFWAPVVLVIHHGSERLAYAALTVLELLVPYGLGRAMVRNSGQFRAMLRQLGIVLSILAVLAAGEAFWQLQLLRPAAELLGDTYPWRLDERLGLWRAQTVFEHPILFGLFSATSACLLFSAGYRRFALAGGVAVFFSLSAGAWLVLLIAAGLILWGRMWGQGQVHWWLLGGGVVSSYLMLEVLSDRTMPQVLANWLSFSPHNAYWRLLTFQFVAENIALSPWVGIGMHDWQRPEWLVTDSVDNFWLVLGLRFGVPGSVILGLAVLARFWQLVLAKDLSNPDQRLRLGACAALVALSVGMYTVHIWGAMFAFFSFLLGATACLAEKKVEIQ